LSQPKLLPKQLLKRVASFEEDEVLDDWISFQAGVVARLNTSTEKLRVLVSMPASREMLKFAVAMMRKLEASKAGDEFKLALFRYDEKPAEEPPRLEGDIGAALNPYIVYQGAGPSCHVQQWRQLTPDFVKEYDYVWHIDGDIGSEFFSWDIFRHYLLELRPMMAQAACLPSQGASVGTGTYWSHLRMRPPKDDGQVPAVWETWYLEMMYPIFSTRIWPVLHQHMTKLPGYQPFPMEGFWSNIFWNILQHHCLDVPGIVVNLAPLKHRNLKGYTKTASHCSKGLGAYDCQEATQQEVDLIAATFCPPDTKTDRESWPQRTPCRHATRPNDATQPDVQRMWYIAYDENAPIPPINASRRTLRLL